MIIDDILKLDAPENPLPLIFDSPHSGTIYPADFNYICDQDLLYKAEDKLVDDLFSHAPNHGACLLSALFPRSYLDVNRARDDIDPELLSAEDIQNWPYPDCTPMNPSNRSYAGIGLIRRLVRPGEPVYNHNLSPKDIKSRIDTYYTPYHDTLEKIIEGAHYNYGQVWHVNCHSMPSPNLTSGALGRINPFPAPDFVLGDRDGTSCDIDFTHALRDLIKSMGYKVAINHPYKGVELVRRYSAPATGRHSLQIEICRSLYLNEDTYEKSKNYENLKADITKLIAFTANYAQSNLTQVAAD
jgi:N-formylglutamate amidohydrolase